MATVISSINSLLDDIHISVFAFVPIYSLSVTLIIMFIPITNSIPYMVHLCEAVCCKSDAREPQMCVIEVIHNEVVCDVVCGSAA